MSAREGGEPGQFWRWREVSWKSDTIDWRGGTIVTAGVDVGSVSSQAVIVVDDELYAFSSQRTGSNSPDSADRVMRWALEGTGMTMADLQYTIGTGYGRVSVPFADRAITEIACHGRGANHMYGSTVRTVLDMGGQDCKAIHTDDRGKVTQFLMNDKCAAGTGRGMEVFADLLGVSIEKIGDMSLDVDEDPPPVSSTCVVFAKSEATSLLRSGWSREKVLAAYCSAMARRIVSLLQRIEVERDLAITGGIAKNRGVTRRLEKLLGLEILDTRYDTQIAGALGAALFGQALVRKGRGRRT